MAWVVGALLDITGRGGSGVDFNGLGVTVVGVGVYVGCQVDKRSEILMIVSISDNVSLGRGHSGCETTGRSEITEST